MNMFCDVCIAALLVTIALWLVNRIFLKSEIARLKDKVASLEKPVEPPVREKSRAIEVVMKNGKLRTVYGTRLEWARSGTLNISDADDKLSASFGPGWIAAVVVTERPSKGAADEQVPQKADSGGSDPLVP